MKQASRYTMQGKMVEQFGNSRIVFEPQVSADGTKWTWEQYQVQENGLWRDSLVPQTTKKALRSKVAAALNAAA